MTGLDIFDKTVQKSHTWVNNLAIELGTENKQQVFQGLRATLHALRDRMPVEEAVHLGAQLPILMAGFYYESWKPARTPSKERTKEAFLAHVRDYFHNTDPSFDTERLVRAVFKLLSERVTEGEIKDVTHMMPSELKGLWPEAVRA